jgi:hypothetical protein
MPIRAQDLLTCASDGVAQEPLPEATARSVVSRAYYAAYHDSRVWHEGLPHQGNCPVDAKGTHNRLCINLQNPHGANERDVRLNSTRRGVLLRKLHSDRVAADYDIDGQMDKADANQAIADAKVICSVR